jgi:hypothetical protein
MAMESRAIAGGRGGELSHYADALPTSPVPAWLKPAQIMAFV